MEEIEECDPQTVAQLLDGRNACVAVMTTDHVVRGELSDIAYFVLIVRLRSAQN